MNLKEKSIEKIYKQAREKSKDNALKAKMKSRQQEILKQKRNNNSKILKDSSLILNRRRKKINLRPKNAQKMSNLNSPRQTVNTITNDLSLLGRFSNSPEMAKNKRSNIQRFNLTSRESLDPNFIKNSPFIKSDNNFLSRLKKATREISHQSKASTSTKKYQLENTLSMLVKDGKETDKINTNRNNDSINMRSSISNSKIKRVLYHKEEGNQMKISIKDNFNFSKEDEEIKILTGEDDEGNHMVINSRTSKSPVRVRGEEEEGIFSKKKKIKNKLKFSYQGESILFNNGNVVNKRENEDFKNFTDRYSKDRLEIEKFKNQILELKTERARKKKKNVVNFFGKGDRKFSMKETLTSKLRNLKSKKEERMNSPLSQLRGKITKLEELNVFDRKKEKEISEVEYEESSKSLKEILEKSRKVKITNFYPLYLIYF